MARKLSVAVILCGLTSLPLAAMAAPLILNEYNGVGPTNFLNDGNNVDPFFGPVMGNGGDWFELVVVADHLDIRGWQVTVNDDGGTSVATLTFADHPLLADLRAGTIITVAAEVADDPSYDPVAGDWSINLQAGAAGSGTYINATEFAVSNNDTTIDIRTGDGLHIFGPAGESISGVGVNSREMFKLEIDPSALITPSSDAYNDGSSSTFGAPNVFSGGTASQDFSPLRSGHPIDDRDFDGVRNCEDTCPETYNPTQRDTDTDGFGDACDPDQGAAPGPGLPPEGCTNVNLYDPNRLLDIEIRMTQANWDALRNQGRKLLDTLGGDCMGGPPVSPFEFVSADITIEGQTRTNIGVRKKGFLGSLDTVRPSLKLRFSRFVSSQRIYGLDRMTLNNAKQDPARIKQCLGYQLFASAGTAASRCNFAHVRLVTENQSYDLGVYANVEDIESPFLESRFGSSGGNLYEGSAGADFRPRSLPIFEKENNEETNDGSDLRALAEVLGRASDAELFAAVEPLVDLDAYYTFWAMEGLIGHWDGYAGDTNNYFLYHNPADGRFHFIPWGIDDTLGQGNPLLNEGSVSPLFWARAKLPRRLYLTPQGAQRYKDKLQTLLDTVWNETAILAEIDRMQALIAPVSGDLSRFINPIRTFVTARRQKFATDFAAGAPAWNESLSDGFCLDTVGHLSTQFSTTWTATVPTLPLSSGIQTLSGSLYGTDFSTAGLRFMVAGGHDLPQFAGLGLIRVVLQVGVPLYVMQVNLQPSDIVPGATIPIESDLANAFVTLDARQRPIFLGSLAAGEVRLDAQNVSTVPGQRIAGELEATITQFAPAPGSCPGDCDRDRQVTAADLVGAVRSTPGGDALNECLPIDRDEDFRVSAAEIGQAIGQVFGRCPGL